MSTSPLKRLEAAHLADLAAEIQRVLDGFVLVDLAALPPRDLLLICAQGVDAEGKPTGGIRRLHLSANRDAARVHIQHGRIEKHKGPEGPFYQATRNALVNLEAPLQLARIHVIEGERALALEWRNAVGAGFLGVEMFGPASNLMLLTSGDEPFDQTSASADSLSERSGAAQSAQTFESDRLRIVCTLATPTGKNVERLAPGAPWTMPAGGKAPKSATPLASYVDTVGPAPERRFPLDAPLSWLVEAAIGGLAEDKADNAERRALIARIERKLERAQSQLKGLAERRSSAEASERVRLDGELLQAHLGTLKRGLTEVTLDDWTTGAPRTLTLDPARSPKQNMEQFFARYKKLQRALSGMAEEEARADERLQALLALLDAANDESETPNDVATRGERAGLIDALQEPKRAPEKRLPYRIFRATTGAEIRVGRTARDNDTLSTRHCRGNDMWLHTADSPGSHVVLCLAGAPEPNPEDLLDAATLALHYSPQRGARKADIHIARGKEVHKPRGAKPGLVTLSGGRTLHLAFEAERLRAITSRQKSADDSSNQD